MGYLQNGTVEQAVRVRGRGNRTGFNVCNQNDWFKLNTHSEQQQKPLLQFDPLMKIILSHVIPITSSTYCIVCVSVIIDDCPPEHVGDAVCGWKEQESRFV